MFETRLTHHLAWITATALALHGCGGDKGGDSGVDTDVTGTATGGTATGGTATGGTATGGTATGGTATGGTGTATGGTATGGTATGGTGTATGGTATGGTATGGTATGGTATGGTATGGTGTATGGTGTGTGGMDPLCLPDATFTYWEGKSDLGHVKVLPGASCPSVDEAVVDILGCRGFDEWLGITCTFDGVSHDQVWEDDYYGGFFTDAGPGAIDVFDVCHYTAIFSVADYTCGRPLRVDGRSVVAATADGDAWGDTLPVVGAASDALRSHAADHWLTSALLEHASVASFSRFVLDLMHHGAPPDLVDDALTAARDEVVHARRCFALASAYAGRPLGAGRMDLAGAGAVNLDRADLAEALVREGCVGESLAAIECAARAAGCTVPAVREVLDTLVRDESRHAALAWRTLRWLLDDDADGAVRLRVGAVFAELADRYGVPALGAAGTADAQAHGLLTDAEVASVHARGWAEVIAPSWAALAA